MTFDTEPFTLRSFLEDLVAACAAGAFVWSVAVWLPSIAH